MIVPDDVFDRMVDEALAGLAEALHRDLQYPWLREFRSPWPDAGFNPHKWTFPEPEPDYCDECGRPFDEDVAS